MRLLPIIIIVSLIAAFTLLLILIWIIPHRGSKARVKTRAHKPPQRSPTKQWTPRYPSRPELEGDIAAYGLYDVRSQRELDGLELFEKDGIERFETDGNERYELGIHTPKSDRSSIWETLSRWTRKTKRDSAKDQAKSQAGSVAQRSIQISRGSP